MALPQPPPPPSGGQLSTPVPIIGPQFCVPYPVDLVIVRKVMSLTCSFVVTDINGNIMFKVKNKIFSLRDKQVLLDTAGNPIITLTRKLMTLRDKRQVFRGDSTNPSNLLFTVKRSSMMQLKTKLNVFLANNPIEEVCNFKVKGSWFARSCIVYAGESSTIVAQMHKKRTVQSVLIGKDKSKVTVNPNIDYAFIAALIMIHELIVRPTKD